MRQWIRDNLPEARGLGRFYHSEGVRTERHVAKDNGIGSFEIAEDRTDINIANSLKSTPRDGFIGYWISKLKQTILRAAVRIRTAIHDLMTYRARKAALLQERLNLVSTAHAAELTTTEANTSTYDGAVINSLLPLSDQQTAQKTRRELFQEALRRAA